MASLLLRLVSAPPGNTCPLLARDHAAPGTILALAKATSLGRGRVRPLAWCSRPRSSAVSLDGARVTDTHAHLDACADPPEAVLARAREAGVRQVIAVGSGLDSCRAT